MMNITLENMINNTLSSLENVISSENFVGKPITMKDGAVIVPLSKISVGFLTGGGEYGKIDDNKPFTSASGGGVTITPIGFFVYQDSDSSLVKIDKDEDSKWTELISSALKLIKNNKDKK